jgi:uncharacterized membrane protein YeaQ/YmgE (transglycosylase-associated protein family)
MGILGWIVLGLIIGALAKLIMPGKDPGGIIVTMIIGIVGSLLGGFIGSKLFHGGLGGFFNLRTWILGLVGSLILLGIWRVIAGRRARA